MRKPPADLMIRVNEEMNALLTGDQNIPVYIDPLTLWAVVSGLQLALRHPGNTGPVSKIQRRFIDRARPRIAPEGSALATLLEMGFDPDDAEGRPEHASSTL